MDQNNSQNLEPRLPEGESGLKKALLGVWEFLKIAIVALIIVLPVRYFLFQPFIVKGDSMYPNFKDRDYLIVDEISYRFNGPQRGDVIVFNYPKDLSQRFIKRVIGLPGETVEVKNGEVGITADSKTTILHETYLPDSLKTYGDSKITLKPNEYFVMGDNREYSYDSRSWGAVPKQDIIGRALLRIFPFSTLGAIIKPIY